MTAYEMLLSESQERMLIVARTGREKEVVEILTSGISTRSSSVRLSKVIV
jgi:hypothetical protein